LRKRLHDQDTWPEGPAGLVIFIVRAGFTCGDVTFADCGIGPGHSLAAILLPLLTWAIAGYAD
jgi:hypothetical protein